ncbi:hypothetical protein OG241_02400 [Streptomyces sp. NBC_01390]|uniref:hypothetical protein n=1 Tax=Streptomyces sp. NBC_01390 TaxID=2903850 RepID=UPI0032516444
MPATGAGTDAVLFTKDEHRQATSSTAREATGPVHLMRAFGVCWGGAAAATSSASRNS